MVARHGKSLIVDAMSSFGAIPIDAQSMPFDALIAASGKCVEGPPGMGFVIARKIGARTLRRQQHVAVARPARSVAVHGEDDAVALHAADARRSSRSPPRSKQFAAEGGQPARLARYARNYETLVRGMAELGFRPFLDPRIQAPIIVTFHAPADPRYNFRAFYDSVRDKGFILYPGKLTQVETFRVGCIGAIGPGRNAACGERGARHARGDEDRARGTDCREARRSVAGGKSGSEMYFGKHQCH